MVFFVSRETKINYIFVVYYKQEEQGNMYSKQSYNYGRHGSKRKLKPIPVIITLLIVILILGGIYFYYLMGK